MSVCDLYHRLGAIEILLLRAALWGQLAVCQMLVSVHVASAIGEATYISRLPDTFPRTSNLMELGGSCLPALYTLQRPSRLHVTGFRRVVARSSKSTITTCTISHCMSDSVKGERVKGRRW